MEHTIPEVTAMAAIENHLQDNQVW